ncbi:hypothetical protein [Streptomyces sp. NPDC050504]|uniref:hypothetical protein n=1 Tax=Streptomyces sp. NPDC050504 TaxID=3365618 RepID=UPI00378B0A88
MIQRRDPTHAPAPAPSQRAPAPSGSSDPPARYEYRSEVAATGPVDGGTVRVVLGSFRTPYLGMAVGWLFAQAHRVADGLDPGPDAHWVDPAQRGALVTSPSLDELPSAPAELRAWCADPGSRGLVYGRLRAGLPFAVTAADPTGTYTLHAVRVDAPVPIRAHALPPRRPAYA